MPGRGPGQSGQALDVSVWPGGLEPVRKLLDWESVLALGKVPSAENRALRLATDLTEAELAGPVFVRNALILLGEIGGGETVWTTNDGRLNKAGVTRMRTNRWSNGDVWFYNFHRNRTHRGRAFRMLNVLDVLSRERLAIRGRRELFSSDLVDVRTDLFILRGIPAYLHSDNSPEFFAAALRQRIAAVGGRTAFIEPGPPWGDGEIGSFNAPARRATERRDRPHPQRIAGRGRWSRRTGSGSWRMM